MGRRQVGDVGVSIVGFTDRRSSSAKRAQRRRRGGSGAPVEHQDCAG